MKGNPELRRALVIEGASISEHCDRIKVLTAEFNHTIRCVDRSSVGTCVTHAFGLLPQFRSLCECLQNPEVRPGLGFMNWMLESEFLKEIETPTSDDRILYFDGGVWKHVGIVGTNGRITSKWGTYAVCDHQIWEIEAGYGDDARFFKPLNPDEAAQSLLRFACWWRDLSPPEIDGLRVQCGLMPAN